ncbi:hypothetical protein SAY86_007973 [Trapa natans]|uniref:Pentatricopeptide repeat-containing protein n=1 Tax=Trapa natans TaxID=22666 RepID=A0AAN7LG09_TRANT|nr:hypothetical protein SAY86_007973 [Trapa natans]
MRLAHLRCLPSFQFHVQSRKFCGKIFLDDDSDPQFVSVLNNIVRGKHSWSYAFNNPFIIASLRPYHVEKVLLETLDDPRLALRFFNFLGLHKNFNHSSAAFSILIHALVQINLLWPASSLLQTLLLRELNPRELFGELLSWYRKCEFSSSLGFDLMIQVYTQNGRVLDAVLIFKLMVDESNLLPEMRTLSGLLNGLARARQFCLTLELFGYILNLGLQLDGFAYTAVVRSLCEMKDLIRAEEVVCLMEKSGCELNMVTYNVLINGLCRNQRISDAIRVKNSLSQKGLRADIVTYCILLLGHCRAHEFYHGMELMTEMLGLGFVPSEAALSGLVEGLRKTG